MGTNTKNIAVIFDMDGTIVNNMDYHKIAWKKFLEKKSIDYDFQKFVKHFGKTNRDLLIMLYGNDLTEKQIFDLAEEKEALYREIYKKDIKPAPGLTDLLKRLQKENIKTAVGTSAPTSNVEFVLEYTKIRKYFDVIVDESMVQKGKPDPAIYLKCAEELEINPTSCLVFEDSKTGIEAGIRAKMNVVGLTTMHSSDYFSGVKLAINDFREISIEKIIELTGTN